MTDWTRLAGMRCTCPPKCTDVRWGDGPRACNPECQPCRLMAGELYEKPDKKKTTITKERAA